MEDIIVSDFDGVLFIRNYGLVKDTVDYLNSRELPVYIVTFRKEDQYDFIFNTVNGQIPLAGVAFAGDRKKNPQSKVRLIEQIRQRYNIVEALDNDEAVVLHYIRLGIPAVRIVRKNSIPQ